MNPVSKSLVAFILFGFQLSAQDTFNPETAIAELIGKKGNIGIAVGYSIDGELVWSGAEGFLCEGENDAFSTSTLTRIASIAKNFTAVAIMQLVEKELLDLEAPIATYLDNLPKDKQAITAKQLLAHTSGVSQYMDENEIENTKHFETLEEAMQVFINRPLLFEPGSKYFYTTYGYVILGRIIEKASDMSYQEYMEKNIFAVAGMYNTTVEEIGKSYPNKSCLYHNNGRKAKAGNQNDLSNRIPGGGFHSTLEDVLKFGNALLEGKLIPLEVLEKMTQPQPVEYDGNKYSLGWFLYGPEPIENVVIGHSGGQTGCTSQLMIVPKSKTVVVVLSNTSGNYPQIATYASNLISFSEGQYRQ